MKVWKLKVFMLFSALSIWYGLVGNWVRIADFVLGGEKVESLSASTHFPLLVLYTLVVVALGSGGGYFAIFAARKIKSGRR
jgi:hypothetical protein